MQTAYKYDKDTKEYIGFQQCQLDPLESERQGREIYLIPANCTPETPPELEPGKAIIFEKGGWQKVPDYRGRRAYNAVHLFTVKYIGNLKPGDNLLTEEQIKGIDEGTLVYKDGQIIPKPPPTVLEQIEALENSITARNIREAILDPEGWAANRIASINAQIEELRKQL